MDNNLRVVRRISKMSSKEFATKIGLHYSVVYSLERLNPNVDRFPFQRFMEISEILKCPIETLLPGIDTYARNRIQRGENPLRVYRVMKGISQDELGEMIGISQSMMTRYELGESIPAIPLVFKCAKILMCDPVELFNFYKDMESHEDGTRATLK
jgi:transcriptional regulator with XRE-family HTH domain